MSIHSEYSAVDLLTSCHRTAQMIIEGDPLLAVGQSIYALGFLITGICLIRGRENILIIYSAITNETQSGLLYICGVTMIIASLLVATGTYATIGLAYLLLILVLGLFNHTMRRLATSWKDGLDSELHFCRVIVTTGITLVLLAGPRWAFIGSGENVISGYSTSLFSIFEMGQILLGSGMILFALSMASDWPRMLAGLEQEDIPYTRLMMTLTMMLLFSFGGLILIDNLVATAMVGLISIWTAFTISILPMWKASNSVNETHKMIHLVTNIQVIGGMIAFIAIYHTRFGVVIGW